MPILSNVELTPNASPHRTMYQINLSLLPFDKSRPTQTYTTGDHLVMHPRNSDRLVDDYLNKIRFTPCLQPDEAITIRKLTSNTNCPTAESTPAMTYREILTHMVELMVPPSMRTLRLLSDHCQRRYIMRTSAYL